MKLKEILNLAVAVEERGRDFYQYMANTADKVEIKQLFLNLATEEEYHARAFKKIGQQLAGECLVDEASAAHFRALLDKIIFPKEHSFSGGLGEALAIGIQAEKDSILFYQQLYENSALGESKRLIGELLKAEKLHLVELRQLEEELV